MKQGELISEDRRKEIFAVVVEIQDQDADVARSRRTVARRFGISEYQVECIEREGIDGEWAPLG